MKIGMRWSWGGVKIQDDPRILATMGGSSDIIIFFLSG
jgi:hypothetical protein